jgi:hypothetical protein
MAARLAAAAALVAAYSAPFVAALDGPTFAGALASPSAAAPNAPAPKPHIAPAPKPHIFMIVIDDYGYNNIGYHARDNEAASEIITPVLDSLALEGLILEQHYVFRFCSPTRSALHTGRNPYVREAPGSSFPGSNTSPPGCERR